MPVFVVIKYSNCRSVLLGLADVAQLLGDGPESLGVFRSALQPGSWPAAGHLALGDSADPSVLFSGARVLVGTQTARE